MGAVTVKVTDSGGHTASASVSYTVGGTPPPSGALFGANFGSGPDESLYPSVVPVVRLFHGSGYPDDITTMSAYKRAKAKGAKVVILDEPAGVTQAQVTAHVSSVVHDGLVCLDSIEHEPEHNNKMSPSAWVAGNIKAAPWIRAAGGKVAPILQAATVAGAQGRVLSDYNLPKGTCDYAGFDLYPKTQSVSQATLLPKFVAAAQSVYGCSQMVFGEYGVPPTGSDSVQLIKDFKAWAATNVYAASFWSQDATVFSQATASAWFS